MLFFFGLFRFFVIFLLIHAFLAREFFGWVFGISSKIDSFEIFTNVLVVSNDFIDVFLLFFLLWLRVFLRLVRVITNHP